MKCVLCNEEMIRSFEGDYNRCGVTNYHFSLEKCDNCNFLATNPVPSNEVYPQSRDEADSFVAVDTKKWNSALLKRVRAYKKNGRLLEIGCNSGDFLQIAQENGFSVFGVEIDQVAAKRGIDLGRNMVHGDILQMQLEEKFDVVVMNHVLEHIPQLLDVPGKLKDLVKDDGIVIINVPNYDGLIVKIMKQNWCQMAPFTHVWFFTKKSIKLLVKDHFKVVDIKTNTNCEPCGFTLSSLKVNLKTLIVKFANLIGWGDELSVVMKKR